MSLVPPGGGPWPPCVLPWASLGPPWAPPGPPAPPPGASLTPPGLPPFPTGVPKPFCRCVGWSQLDPHSDFAINNNCFLTFSRPPKATKRPPGSTKGPPRTPLRPPRGRGFAHSRGPDPPRKTSQVPRGGPGPPRGLPGPQIFAKNLPFWRTRSFCAIFEKPCNSLGKTYIFRRAASKTNFANVNRASGAPRKGLGGALAALRLTF